MTISIDDVKTAVINIITTPVMALEASDGVTVNAIYDHAVIPTRLKDNISVAFIGQQPDRGATGGKRRFHNFVFTVGRIYSTTEESMSGAEAALNLIEDTIINALDGSSNSQWLKAAFAKSTRPNSPRGISNIRYAEIFFRFRLR